MGKLKLFWVLCVLGAWVVANGATPSHAPSPSVDCSAVLLSMADCLTFVMNGSTISKPEGSCCSGFKTVLKDDPKCLCEAFNNNNNLGIALNMTKASTLPSACAVSTPPMSNCGFSSAPSDAPVPSPSPTASLQIRGSPSNPTSTGAPKQSQSNAAAISISVAVILASLVTNGAGRLQHWCCHANRRQSTVKASVEEIKKAYRIMALVYHPDVCHPSRKEESTQMFLQLHKAYETLSDPILRKQHDRELGLNGVVNDEGEWEFARERWENQLCGLKMRSDYRMRRKEGKSFKGRMRA
ncbi:hypothetical protein MRB53_000144 [Persea americana]|uniref:Uncharacterized protein n=1 Tax=Persea americana TaxID=3435 RepID=A0ACC2MNZ2_PERAE|nr:hypothetical protein MRB53_000144 [Persea americana]